MRSVLALIATVIATLAISTLITDRAVRPDTQHRDAAPPDSTYASAPGPGDIRGIDVSSNNAPIDWPTVAAEGNRFAYVKATQGTTYTNPYFASDTAAAKANGLYVGSYALVTPNVPNPAAQADYFYKVAGYANDGQTLPPWIDLEWGAIAGSSACWDLSPAGLSNWLRTFIGEYVAISGRQPMIYTNTNWWLQCLGNDTSFAGYGVAVANYTNVAPPPPGWQTFTMWQYTNNTGVQHTDGSIFNGSIAQLAALAARAPDRTRPSPAAAEVVARDGVRFVDVFTVQADGSIWTSWWNSVGGWGGPGPLAMLRAAPGTTPAVVETIDKDGIRRVDVFATQDDGTVRTAYWIGTVGWAGAGPVPGLSVTAGSSLAAAETVDRGGVRRIDIFAAQNNRSVATMWWASTTGWAGPVTLPGLAVSLQSSPGAAETMDASGIRRLDVFALQADSTVLTDYWSSDYPFTGGWSGPAQVGGLRGAPGATPAAAQTVDPGGIRRLDVFAVQSDGSVFTAYWNSAAVANGGWGGPGAVPALSGRAGSSVAVAQSVAVWGTRLVDVFAVAGAGQVITSYWASDVPTNLGWRGPGPVPGLSA